MTEEEIKVHPNFMKISETNPATFEKYKEDIERVKTFYFRNQLSTHSWEKAQIEIPINLPTAQKRGLSFVYFVTKYEGKPTIIQDINQCPEWFSRIYRSLEYSYEKKWKVKLLLNKRKT